MYTLLATGIVLKIKSINLNGEFFKDILNRDGRNFPPLPES
jgi:hypothetical protein